MREPGAGEASSRRGKPRAMIATVARPGRSADRPGHGGGPGSEPVARWEDPEADQWRTAGADDPSGATAVGAGGERTDNAVKQ